MHVVTSCGAVQSERRPDDDLVDSGSEDEGIVGSGDEVERIGAKAGRAKASGASDDGLGMSVGASARQPAEVASGAQGMASANIRASDKDDPSVVYISRELDGLRLLREEFTSKTNPTRSYDRMVVFCKCPGHGADCAKRRAIGAAQQADLGVWQPIAFLMAWAARAGEFPDRGSHLHFAPSLDEQRAWLDTHRSS